MKKFISRIFSFVVCGISLCAAADMIVRADDIRLVYENGTDFSSVSGYHLYIRKKDGVESVMLVETTRDLEGKSDNYAYRAAEYNPVNGDEIRYLDGKVLDSKYARYSLIDSTAEQTSFFGEAFHIFIPAEIEFGYPWSRNGTVRISRGTFINIRTFEKKYGDYTGAYADNPFMFDLGEPRIPEKKQPEPEIPAPDDNEPEIPAAIEEPEPELPPPEEPEAIILTDDYNPVAAETFKDIAGFGGGKMVFSKGPESLPDDIMESLDRIQNKNCADVIFAIDTTGSMKDDIQMLREVWIPQLLEKVREFKNLRLGLLLYRDYGDTYKFMDLPVKKFEFTDSVQVFKKNLVSFTIYGTEGGDIPEAVYEALYAALKFYRWRSDAEKKIILIGDAEPHPSPRGSGKYSKEFVSALANENAVLIDTIIVPDDKSARGR